jgi:pyruvate/2-oxoglutarate dehydrogenase complex dihydrolipoamide acyltransferase (E2) component
MAADDRDRDRILPPEDDWFAEVDDVSEPAARPAPTRARVEPGPPPPRRPMDPRTRLLALAGIAVAVVLIVGGIVLARALGDSDDEGSPTATLPTSPTPPPTPTPTPTPPPTPPATQPPAGPAPELPPDGTYRRGEQGDSVLAIQQALTQLGFDPGDVDGRFGEQTEQAVIAFQNSAELTADGIVGAATLEAMTQALADRG